MENKIVLNCEDSIDGMFSAMYDAFTYKNAHSQIKPEDIHILAGNIENYELFTQYITVQTDYSKAAKTTETIQKRISYKSYVDLFGAAANFECSRGDMIYNYLLEGFRAGSEITEMLANPYVMAVEELKRKTYNEVQRFNGFIRFKELDNGVLFSLIEPKCHVLYMCADHFYRRYPNENWMIYDEKHGYAAIHEVGHRWNIVTQNINEIMNKDNDIAVYDQYETLWKAYFKTIAIESRTNPVCQRNMLPKWYRKHMFEFDE